jgi:hypothetical protein
VRLIFIVKNPVYRFNVSSLGVAHGDVISHVATAAGRRSDTRPMNTMNNTKNATLKANNISNPFLPTIDHCSSGAASTWLLSG